MTSNCIYYVYAYLRQDGTPYYIGKGKGDRATSPNHRINLPTSRNRIVFLETKLTELGAFALERRYIRWYGRKDLGTGILQNRTDGGEGPDGRIHSPESKQKMSMAKLGKSTGPRSQDTCRLISERTRGVKRSDEAKKNISEAHKGIPQSAESRAKKSLKLKGKKFSAETIQKRIESRRRNAEVRNRTLSPTQLQDNTSAVDCEQQIG